MKTIVAIFVGVVVSSVAQGSFAQGDACRDCGFMGGRFACINSMSGYTSCIMVNGLCDLGPGCGIAGGCFLAGTTVETPNGSVPIEKLSVGDVVISARTDDGHPELAKVSKTYRVIQYEYFVINGFTSVTASHPFVTSRGWVIAEELSVGDEITGDGEVIRVDSIERRDCGVRAYNIEVEGSHTFYADGFLVHNKPYVE